MYLIYINKIGTNFKGEHMFEFLFSDTTEWEWDEEWYESSVITDTTDLTPNPQIIKKIGFLKTNKLDLELVQESGVFDVYNAVEKIIALGWEKLDEESDLESERVVFHFGDDVEKVESNLYQFDLILNYKENKILD
jgi:hypothetical protein